ncbi:hypothetical protein DL766_006599 [Monosporascus sp. MC13-8B]|uniref:SMP domain-containing protein n=1 Tax=Monosporascus cannonballus TaxID=155416 RepID=A0ABY0HG42_9PEZI|nr:hypothetical protein DL763_008708 [Monosporascus cannonballus]RYO91842.1 hypothetical protein DL762_001922 [Monosporascus cannonballus]RYP26793.1 hypothetical protein DL766_006599 [Monosporascus sp. MC13-8B]
MAHLRTILTRATRTAAAPRGFAPTSLPASRALLHRSAAARAPYKDDMDRESLKPKAHENTQSGTDDQAAQNEDAAFNPDKTSPESERAAAGAANNPNTNPLEKSPANQGFAGNTTGAKEDQRRGGGGNHRKPSGGGDTPKSGKVTNN